MTRRFNGALAGCVPFWFALIHRPGAAACRGPVGAPICRSARRAARRHRGAVGASSRTSSSCPPRRAFLPACHLRFARRRVARVPAYSGLPPEPRRPPSTLGPRIGDGGSPTTELLKRDNHRQHAIGLNQNGYGLGFGDGRRELWGQHAPPVHQPRTRPCSLCILFI